MKIIVCFKIIHDLESVIPNDWKNAYDKSFSLDYTKYIFGSFDETAIEAALMIKDLDPNTEITAICVNAPSSFPTFVQLLYAIGVDKVVGIRINSNLQYNCSATAALLASYIKTHSFDAVFTGNQVSNGNSSKIGALIASELDVPHFFNVSSVKTENDNWIIEYLTNLERINLKQPGKVVLSFGLSNNAYLRVPTLKTRLKVKEYKAEEININSFDVDSDYYITSLSREDHIRKGTIIDGKNEVEITNNLLNTLDSIWRL